MRNYNSLLIRLSAACLFALVFAYNADCQIATITQRLREDLIAGNIDDAEITRYFSTLKPDGSWSNIDYSSTSNTNWPPTNHSGRLKLICAAYNKPSSIYYHQNEVKAKILSIIKFYITAKPKSANWWYNAIGAPINFGPALVLMKTGDSFGFDQSTLDSFADELLNYFSESAEKWPFATTGANKIWLLSSSIAKACLKNNDSVLSSNFRSAFEEAKIMTGTDEGIKADYSFYQHGPQLYCGGYGMSFMNDITYFGILAHGTDYQMSDSQLQVITNSILEGFQWFCQKSAFDFGATGREISRPGAGSSAALKTMIMRLKTMNPVRAEDLTGCYNFIAGTGSFNHPGNKHFWKSDIMVTHGSDFYLSARIPSKRTTGTERMNNENLKRKWLPWGATNIMIDGDEYRNLFPVWDWSSIPGVTSVRENVPGMPVTGGAYLVSNSEFAGGVSDGAFGLAAYDYSWDGVEGRKAYFFTPDAMYCFGAGIKASKSEPVITTINQCFSSDPVIINVKGKTSCMTTPEMTTSDLSWVYHKGVGYLFPAGGNITVKNTEQTGSWNDINLSQSSTPVTHKVFSNVVEHGKNPINEKYEYIVVPSKSPEQFKTWMKTDPLKMILNTADVQSISDKKAGVSGVAFYKPGSVTLEPGLTITTNKACLLLIQNINKGSRYKISVSDPTTTLNDIILVISKKLTGAGAVINQEKTTSISLKLPSGDEAGRTISREYFSSR